jgi:hypothetical protein
VLEKRGSRSQPNVGFVVVKTIGCNQDGVTVIESKPTTMVREKDHTLEIPRSSVGDHG